MLRNVKIMIGVDPYTFLPDNMPTMENARLLESLELSCNDVAKKIEASGKWPVSINTALVNWKAGTVSTVENDGGYDRLAVKALEAAVLAEFRVLLRNAWELVLHPPVVVPPKGGKK